MNFRRREAYRRFISLPPRVGPRDEIRGFRPKSYVGWSGLKFEIPAYSGNNMRRYEGNGTEMRGPRDEIKLKFHGDKSCRKVGRDREKEKERERERYYAYPIDFADELSRSRP